MAAVYKAVPSLGVMRSGVLVGALGTRNLLLTGSSCICNMYWGACLGGLVREGGLVCSQGGYGFERDRLRGVTGRVKGRDKQAGGEGKRGSLRVE